MTQPRHLLVAAFLIGSAIALDAGAQAAPAATAPASLSGTVRDTDGAPIVGTEVILREAGRDIRSVRASASGDFLLTDVASGAYVVWFRRLGFASVDYNWAARAGYRDTVRVRMSALPHGLNPVIVREREDKMMKGTASLLGLVVDTEGVAIEDASVDLIGADRGGNTRPNGGFLFKPLPAGPYVVRVRKVGYAPQFVTMSLQDLEERELVVRLRPLGTMLDAVQVLERSGYGAADKQALEDLDRRMRWHGMQSFVLGPDRLHQFRGGSLELAANALGTDALAAMKARRTANRHIEPRGTSDGGAMNGLWVEGDVCVLVNGRSNEVRPLRSYDIDDIELLEVYPSKTEVTRTIGDRMHRPCEERLDGSHRTWYVLWFKGRS